MSYYIWRANSSRRRPANLPNRPWAVGVRITETHEPRITSPTRLSFLPQSRRKRRRDAGRTARKLLFSLSSPNKFDLGFYRRGAGKTEKFESPGVVNVYCNVHPDMSAVIHVMPSPYYVFADKDGNFSIPNVLPGDYRISAWNEVGGSSSEEIVVPRDGSLRGVAVTIDGRNHRSAQHLDKDGKPYKKSRSRDY